MRAAGDPHRATRGVAFAKLRALGFHVRGHGQIELEIARDVRERATEAITEAREEFETRVKDARGVIRERRRDVNEAVRSGRAAARDARSAFERRLAEARASRTEPEVGSD